MSHDLKCIKLDWTIVYEGQKFKTIFANISKEVFTFS